MNKRMINIVLLSFAGIMALTGCDDKSVTDGSGPEPEKSYPNRYYIDPENGAYYNTGHSPSQAWESVGRFTERLWKGGDTILIKRGTVYEGSLTLRGSGESGKPIVLGSYGDESLPLPEIRGGGKAEQAIHIKNVQHWVIQDLRITNKGEEPVARIAGIRIEADGIEGGVMNTIHIKRCEIHDVYGTKTHFIGGGGAAVAIYNAIENDNPAAFNDLLIEDCYIKDCQRDGIKWYISTGNRSKLKLSTNVVFRGNLIEGVPGDQILANGCKGALVEYNIVRNCAQGDFLPDGYEWDDPEIGFNGEMAASVWCMHSDDTVFRYNIVQDHKATWDGQAFDCDQNCQNTLFEYNISYNNVGGFMLICPLFDETEYGYVEHRGTIVRYNISINDGLRDYKTEDGNIISPSITVVGPVYDAHFYNNTIIKTKSAPRNTDNRAIALIGYTNQPNSLVFTNNIFYNTTAVANELIGVSSGPELQENKGVVFRNNCLFGYKDDRIPGTGGYNSGNITSDPRFVALIEDFVSNNGFADKEAILEGLRLASGSPCIGSGTAPDDGGYFPVTNDFWGEPVTAKNNIGAYNH